MRNLIFFGISFLLCSGFIIFPAANGLLDLSNLFSYDSQEFPEKALYRWNDENPVSDKGATLGRVLFYDTKLSVNNTTACASCHQQENAFGDSRQVSIGFNGEPTERHAMRLINVDFHADNRKFWDERTARLENTVTLPFQNPIEMGFSGKDGFPSMDSLLRKMDDLAYYKILFEEAFGDQNITEDRMALALAQFIRSITTFDSKFDEGFNIVGEEITHFPNFTEEENRGKRLFFNPPAGIFGTRDVSAPTGAACGFCHKAPGFDLIHLSSNNGVIGVAGDSTAIDISIRRSPSLKNLVKPDGSSNGPFMHDGSISTLEDVIEHYNFIPFDPRNELLSGLLFPMANGNVELLLNEQEKSDLVTFLKTLSGNDVYTNEKWSNPFDENGNLTVINCESCEIASLEDTISVDTIVTDNIKIQDSIFTEFSWLEELVNISDCEGTSIHVFDKGAFSYLIIESAQNVEMYFEDGQFYCQDSQDFSCQSAYKLAEPTYTWSCESEDESQINIDVKSLAIQNQSPKDELSVFPNPSFGDFEVNLPTDFSEGQLSLFSMNGKLIYKQDIMSTRELNTVSIDLYKEAPGMYILQLVSEDQRYSKKVILK